MKSNDAQDVSSGEGVKHDADKPEMALLPGKPLYRVAEVLTYGAKKYAPDNWRAGMRTRRLLSAAFRHLFAYSDGETLDPETGISHLAHAMCMLLFALDMEETRPDMDDRYRPSKSSSEIKDIMARTANGGINPNDGGSYDVSPL